MKKSLLEQIGLGDGEGNISSQRVFMFIVIVCWAVYKVRNNEAMGTEDDRWLLGIVFGSGIGKTLAESKSPPSVVVSAPPVAVVAVDKPTT